MDTNTAKLQEWIHASKYTVAITGAGISTVAGIPDMKHLNLPSTLQMMSETLLKATPNHYYKGVYKGFLKAMYDNGPTITHQKLLEMEARSLLHGIITTNLDCLHSLAGSQNVAEIQGSFAVNICLGCGKEYSDPFLWSHGSCPKCQMCGGALSIYPVHSHVGLLNCDVQKAREWISKAELVIIIGSNGPYSGVYYDYVKPSAKIVQINPKHTAFDSVAILNIQKSTDEVFRLIS